MWLIASTLWFVCLCLVMAAPHVALTHPRPQTLRSRRGRGHDSGRSSHSWPRAALYTLHSALCLRYPVSFTRQWRRWPGRQEAGGRGCSTTLASLQASRTKLNDLARIYYISYMYYVLKASVCLAECFNWNAIFDFNRNYCNPKVGDW